MPPEALTLVERYGSFGLLVVIVFAAMAGGVWTVRWLKNDFVPRAFAYLEAKDARHEQALAKKDTDHATHLLARDEAQVRALGKVTDSLEKVCERLEKVEDRVDGMTRQRGEP